MRFPFWDEAPKNEIRIGKMRMESGESSRDVNRDPKNHCN